MPFNEWVAILPHIGAEGNDDDDDDVLFVRNLLIFPFYSQLYCIQLNTEETYKQFSSNYCNFHVVIFLIHIIPYLMVTQQRPLVKPQRPAQTQNELM